MGNYCGSKQEVKQEAWNQELNEIEEDSKESLFESVKFLFTRVLFGTKMSAKSLFPHQQLKWLSKNLETDLARSREKLPIYNKLAMVYISQAFFHDGGEGACAKALSYTRKALLEQSDSVVALAISGLALLGTGRPQKSYQYISQAESIDPNNPLVLLAQGEYAKSNGDMPTLLHYFERACQYTSDKWEINFLYGRSLLAYGMQKGESKSLHRALYHLVLANDLGVIASQKYLLYREIGIACLHTGRYTEAERYFIRIQEKLQQK